MTTRKFISFAQQIAIDRHYIGYVLGGCWNPFNRSAGTDCSDCVGKELAASVSGTAMNWAREVDTESWRPPALGGTADPNNGPYGTVMVNDPSEFPADAAVLIALHHGDGEATDSHMWCQVDQLKVETHGSDNTYPDGATVLNDGVNFHDSVLDVHDTSYANNWWYLRGPINEDGTPIPTQPSPIGGGMTAPKILSTGVDYSAGYPGGAAVAAAGFTFAVRYVFDGSPDLPYKLLKKPEADDLWANDVDVVSNFESTGTDALSGFAQGVADAQQANANHLAAGGPADRPILFSLDWDESEGQDPAVDAYFQGVNSVIGLERTGAYGGYWIIKRLFDAGLITYGWQTEAWSSDPAGLGQEDMDGNYVDPRAQLLQRNDVGYSTVNGVQCDVDVALAEDFGQWHYQAAPAPDPTPSTDDATDSENIAYAAGQLGPWPQLAGDPEALATLAQKIAAGQPLTLVDGLAAHIFGLLPQSTVTPAIEPVPAPAPAVDPVPAVDPAPAPTPTPVPAPAPVSTGTISVRVTTAIHAAISVVGGGLALGSYLIDHHIFSGAVAAGISSAVVAGTSLLNFLVKEENTIQGGN